MAIDTTVPRTRRAVLAASLGGLAAALAAVLGRPGHVDAANGDPVVAGQETTATVETGVTSSSSTVFYGHSSSSGIGLLGESSSGDGVRGTTTSGHGVRGQSSSSAGVSGLSSSYYGVWGESGTNYGVYGQSSGSAGVKGTSSASTGVWGVGDPGVQGDSSTGDGVLGQGADSGVHGYSVAGAGVWAESSSGRGLVATSASTSLPGALGTSFGNGTGVQGFSGAGGQPAAPAKTGVFGAATQDSGSRGVHGKSTAGRGVFGQATSGSGLYGSATTGYALRTSGRLRFDGSGGSATIAAGNKSVTVNPGINLTASSVVIATLQGNAGGTNAVSRVVVDPAADTFRIFLVSNASSSVEVGWLVFG